MEPSERPIIPASVPSVGGSAQMLPLWACWLLFISLTAFFVLVVLVVAFVIGIIALDLGLLAAARSLDAVGALDDDWPRAIGLGAFFSVAAFLSAIGWRGVRATATWLADAPPYRPLWGVTGPTIALVGWLLIQFAVFVPLDQLMIVDVPDARLGSAIVATVVFFSLSLVWWLARLGFITCRALWRWSLPRPVLAGMVLMGAGVLSTGTAALVTPHLLEAAQAQPFPGQTDSEVLETIRLSLVEAASTGATSTAPQEVGLYGKLSSAGGNDGGGGLQECFEQLRGPACGRVWQKAEQGFGAGDEIQQAFVYVCAQRQMRPPELCGSFLLKAQGLKRDAWRYDQRVESVLNRISVPCPVPTPPDEYMSRQELLLLRRARAALDERSRRILQLAYEEELTDKEIAEELGLSTVRVRVLRREAEKALKEKLQDCR